MNDISLLHIALIYLAVIRSSLEIKWSQGNLTATSTLSIEVRR